MERVIVYIDGFNLYFGIRSKGWARYLWLDLPALAGRLVKPNQKLVGVRYFTARVRDDKGKVARQGTYLQALGARGGLDISFGRYQRKPRVCRNCAHTWTEYEEKMSDVRLSTEVVRDAFKDKFDTAILVTADTDIQPSIEIVKAEFPKKRVVLAFPPDRDNPGLKKFVDDWFRIGRGRLSKCQLPKTVKKPDGYVLRKPKSWA
jgi:uncharacterized LabA/DUF88 family protein